jgi:mannose-1-phosphate guanylyltransferase
MKAIALAAGFGTRLGSITQQLPKCMLEVGGAPLLWRNLEWAAANSITEVAVNLHHQPDVVTSYFDDRGYPLPIHFSREPSLLGTAGTLRSLREWVGSAPFAVIYADNLIDCDLEAVVRTHQRLDALVTVALFDREDVSQSGVAELDPDGRIASFVEKPSEGETSSHWVSAGLLVLEAEVARLAPAEGDIGRDLLPRLIATGRRVAGYRMGPRETLHWIDTPEDLDRTRSAFAEVLR